MFYHKVRYRIEEPRLLEAIPHIGDTIVLRIWGGFSINNATLNRFYSSFSNLIYIVICSSFNNMDHQIHYRIKLQQL